MSIEIILFGVIALVLVFDFALKGINKKNIQDDVDRIGEEQSKKKPFNFNYILARKRNILTFIFIVILFKPIIIFQFFLVCFSLIVISCHVSLFFLILRFASFTICTGSYPKAL